MKRAFAAATLLVLIACTPPPPPAPQDQALAALQKRFGPDTELRAVTIAETGSGTAVCGITGQRQKPGDQAWPGPSGPRFIYSRGDLRTDDGDEVERTAFERDIRSTCPEMPTPLPLVH